MLGHISGLGKSCRCHICHIEFWMNVQSAFPCCIMLSAFSSEQLLLSNFYQTVLYIEKNVDKRVAVNQDLKTSPDQAWLFKTG